MKKITIHLVMALLWPKRTQIKLKIPAALFTLLLIFTQANTFAQLNHQIAITGFVTSEDDNKPLPGATIQIGNSKIQVATGRDGKFEILTRDSTGILNISFIGYQSRQIKFSQSNRGPFNILMTPNPSVLKEVVVSTGYQTLPKERATGSFVQIDSTLLNRRVSTEVISKLEGIVPGLLFNRNTSGSANGTLDISIRGHNTLFSNDQPLIVLDNFPYDGDINNINPNDIASITVLKDAAAASIWGVRSGNGVVVLTSKKGKQNQKLAIELNANVTVGSKPNLYYNPNFLNSTDYINIEKTLFSQGFYNSLIGDPSQVISPVVQLLANEQAGTISADAANAQIANFETHDIRNDLNKYFYTKSVLQQYNLNFKGGGDKSDYFFSAGEDHNQTNEVGNVNNRITLNGNYNFYPAKNLQITTGLNYIQSTNQNNSPVGNISAGGNYAGFIYPYAQLADASGNPLQIVKDHNYDYATSAPQQGLLNWQYSPLDELRNADNVTNTIDNRINLGVNYKVLPGLSASIKYLYEKESVSVNDYFNTNTYYTRNLINEYTQNNGNGTLSYPIPVGGILQESNAYLTSQQLRGQINYTHAFNQKNEFNAIGGAEISETVNEGDSNVAYGYDRNTASNYTQIDYADYFNLNPNSGSAQIPNNQSFVKTTDHYLSYFSNASYTYDERFTFSISGRIDRSNLFGVATNQKSVPLYSTGASWQISKENYYHIEWLPYLKIRATYGYNANINKSATAVTTLQQQSNSFFSGTPYDIIASPGNPELRFEKVQMTNFGLDYGLKNNIISGSIEYYLKKGTDLFGSSPPAPSTGLTNFFGNTAGTSGKGFDLVINSRNIYGEDFKWTSNLLISHVIDKVTNYSEQSDVITYLSTGSGNAGVITPLVGQPIFAIYSFKSGPLTHDTGDPQGYLNGKLSTDYAAIIANTPVQGLYYNGPSRPTTFGSLRNTFSYKNWSVSANIIFKLDYYFRRSSTAISYSGIVYGGVNQDYAKRWQKPGDELTTTVPSIQMPPQMETVIISINILRPSLTERIISDFRI